jgi:hypothetical protein
MKDRIKELCKKANLNEEPTSFKPEIYTSFVWMRSLGDARISAAKDLGVHDRTLERWENKVNENLELEEFAELVVLAVNFEYKQRIGSE